MKEIILGIDYGSKLAGTTVVSSWIDGKWMLQQSKKKEDADGMIQTICKKYSPALLSIDAPLSLPAAYFGRGTNFFYRECDQHLQAMSPMFLGGLTARAMQLKAQLNKHLFIEAYPKQTALLAPALARDRYKGSTADIQAFIDHLQVIFPVTLPTCSNWHQVDSVLAWWTGYRYLLGKASLYGDPKEGLIYV